MRRSQLAGPCKSEPTCPNAAGDIANMGFARAVGTPVILVGDIDRGHVIAALVGAHAVLDQADRALIHGFVINKFRGASALFDAESATGGRCEPTAAFARTAELMTSSTSAAALQPARAITGRPSARSAAAQRATAPAAGIASNTR